VPNSSGDQLCGLVTTALSESDSVPKNSPPIHPHPNPPTHTRQTNICACFATAVTNKTPSGTGSLSPLRQDRGSATPKSHTGCMKSYSIRCVENPLGTPDRLAVHLLACLSKSIMAPFPFHRSSEVSARQKWCYDVLKQSSKSSRAEPCQVRLAIPNLTLETASVNDKTLSTNQRCSIATRAARARWAACETHKLRWVRAARANDMASTREKNHTDAGIQKHMSYGPHGRRNPKEVGSGNSMSQPIASRSASAKQQKQHKT
jgi:hypothetical protein